MNTPTNPSATQWIVGFGSLGLAIFFSALAGVALNKQKTLWNLQIANQHTLQRLAQVLANLLPNAAKFSPTGEAVDVRVQQRDARIRVSVTDHGPGGRKTSRHASSANFPRPMPPILGKMAAPVLAWPSTRKSSSAWAGRSALTRLRAGAALSGSTFPSASQQHR
jgi:hypothetical protein